MGQTKLAMKFKIRDLANSKFILLEDGATLKHKILRTILDYSEHRPRQIALTPGERFIVPGSPLSPHSPLALGGSPHLHNALLGF